MILEADSRQIIPLRYNEAQHRLYRMHQWFREHRLPVRIIICKARRAGLSTGVESLIYDDTTTIPNTRSLIVANEKNPSENILAMCTLFWRKTPEFFEYKGQKIALRPPLPSQFNNNPPKDRLEFAPPLDSKIFVATARSLDGYLGHGFQNVHATEAAYYMDGPGLFRALYPTLSSKPHSALYIESTPNGQQDRGEWFFNNCMDAHERKKTEYGDMRLLFITWHEMVKSFSIPFREEESRVAFSKSLKPPEKDLLTRFPHISMEQLQWRRMMLAGPVFNRDEDLFDQEFPTDLATAFLASGVTVFARKAIKRLMEHSRPPIWEGDVYWGDNPTKNESVPIHELVRTPKLLDRVDARDQGYKPHVIDGTYRNLRIYRYPEKGERLFCTCDVGKGNPETRDGDYSTISVGVLNELNRDEYIATWMGRLNPLVFAEVASALCWWLAYRVGDDETRMPELCPEWTGPGGPMCTYIDTKHLYPNLYRYRDLMKVGSKQTNTLGWETNSKTKPFAVACTQRMIEQDLIDIPDADVILQMSSYREIDSFNDAGSYEGAGGRHDDLVSSASILCARLRMAAATLPGIEEASQVDQFGYDEDLPSFSPFDQEIPGMPGITTRDFDDESFDEWGRW
jgi:hypothetical protein